MVVGPRCLGADVTRRRGASGAEVSELLSCSAKSVAWKI